MRDILWDYSVNPTTWVYLSSLMTLTIYFKFSRVWSVRNLDLMGLIALSPGLLLIDRGGGLENVGYVVLFVVGGFFLLRLLIDPHLVRRPLLEPNLSAGGLAFMGAALLVFLLTNVVTGELKVGDAGETRALSEESPDGSDTSQSEPQLAGHDLAHPLLRLLPNISNRAMISADKSSDSQPAQLPPSEAAASQEPPGPSYAVAAKTVAIISHLAVVIGIVLIAYRHFDSVRMGVAAAALYLLLPYTAQMTGRIDHVLPAALLVWAVALYRSPTAAGMLLGLAAGAIFYPIFLLPLWIGFYWQRGLLRFSLGVLAMLLVSVGGLAFVSADVGMFLGYLAGWVGWVMIPLDDVSGFWASHIGAFRITVIAAFAALAGGFALWPVQKNLGTLLSCSAAVMLGTQFWQAHEGGLHMAWYLPLLLLTIFRPNLDDRIALTTLGEGWLAKRKTHRLRVVKAA